ncbi:MAG: polyketide cyclase, partial [Acidobacteria bacterium]
MNRVKLALGGFATGALLMYLSDPDRGKRRRALARDKAVSAWNDFATLLDKARRDVSNRAYGAACGVKAAFGADHPAEGPALVQRVRSRMGRVVSHPHAIDVTLEDGRIVLYGPALEHEVDRLLRAVKSVPGVKEVTNRLVVHRDPARISSLQGGVPRESRSEFTQQYWTPALRVAAGGAGAALLWNCLRNRSALSLCGGVAGTALLTRAVANREFRQIVGAGGGPRVFEFDKVVHIHAPAADVFAFWSDYEKFPRFMTHLKEVRDLGGGKSHWVAEGPAGVPVSWDAEITEQVPNQLLAWRSMPGSAVETEGVVRFDENADASTRVTIRLFYKP